jgi:hypothetical protein
MEWIIGSGPSEDNRRHHVFLNKWKVCSEEENMWETNENVAKQDLELLEDYYGRNVAKDRDERFGKKGKTRKLIKDKRKKKRS